MQHQVIESTPSSAASPAIRMLVPITRIVEADVLATQPLPEQPARDFIGAEVFFVLSSGFSTGQRRPAVVVRDWGNNLVNLQVFVDGFNDFASGDIGSDGPSWATSVQDAPAASRELGTWHWRSESF